MQARGQRLPLVVLATGLVFASGFLAVAFLAIGSSFSGLETKLPAFCGYIESTVGRAGIRRKAYPRFVSDFV